MSTLGERLRFLREQKGLKQNDFAGQMSVSPSAVNQWESNKTVPDVAYLAKMADFFSVSVDFLLGKREQQKVLMDEVLKDDPETRAFLDTYWENRELILFLSSRKDLSPKALRRVKAVIEAIEAAEAEAEGEDPTHHESLNGS